MSIIAEYAKDALATNILEGHLKDDRFRIREGLILYNYRIYLVPRSKVKEKITAALHDMPLARHMGM